MKRTVSQHWHCSLFLRCLLQKALLVPEEYERHEWCASMVCQCIFKTRIDKDAAVSRACTELNIAHLENLPMFCLRLSPLRIETFSVLLETILEVYWWMNKFIKVLESLWKTIRIVLLKLRWYMKTLLSHLLLFWSLTAWWVWSSKDISNPLTTSAILEARQFR